MTNQAGISSTGSITVWRCPVTCSVTNVRGYKVGGTGARINAIRNGTDTHLAADLLVNTDNAWTDGGAVTNTAYAGGDRLTIRILNLTGSVTEVAVQVDFSR